MQIFYQKEACIYSIYSYNMLSLKELVLSRLEDASNTFSGANQKRPPLQIVTTSSE